MVELLLRPSSHFHPVWRAIVFTGRVERAPPMPVPPACGAEGQMSREVGARPNLSPALHRTVSFFFGAETRRVLVSALGLGRSRKRVWHHAKSMPTSSRASEPPHGQAYSMIAMTR